MKEGMQLQDRRRQEFFDSIPHHPKRRGNICNYLSKPSQVGTVYSDLGMLLSAVYKIAQGKGLIEPRKN